MVESRARRERDTEVREALATVESVLDRLGVEARVREVVGTTGEPRYVVTRGELYRDGEFVTGSTGKGLGRQSWASATFELLEHYVMSRANRPWDPEPTLRPLGVVAEPLAEQDGLFEMMASRDPDGLVACFPYAGSDGSTIELPLAYADIDYRDHRLPGDVYDYTAYLKYFSTSGIASGSGPADATLHGVLELIERDALSRALLGVARFAPRVARWIDHSRLPEDLRSLLPLLHDLVGAKVELYEIPSLAGTTTCLAVGPRGGKPAWFGAGTSLWPDYAVERALTELMQDVAVPALVGLQETHDRLDARLDPFPSLARTVRPDRDDLCLPGVESTTDFRASAAGVGGSSAATLARLSDRLAADGLVVYSRILLGNAASVVSTYIPGLERFFSLRHNYPLVPTGRDRRSMTA